MSRSELAQGGHRNPGRPLKNSRNCQTPRSSSRSVRQSQSSDRDAAMNSSLRARGIVQCPARGWHVNSGAELSSFLALLQNRHANKILLRETHSAVNTSRTRTTQSRTREQNCTHLAQMPSTTGFQRRSLSTISEVTSADQNKFLKAIADLRKPHLWFPQARKMKRKWLVHVGPTNSGKTHQALTRLAESERGVYCGPLRLLAWEVHDKLSEGIISGIVKPCSLITGQEKIIMAGAGHVSSTIEMVDLRQVVDVGVVDEVQMLNSEDRGWAWTRSVLGLPVEELHLCGEARTVPLIEKMCAMCGDSLEVKEYERLSPLEVSSESLGGSLTRVQAGDCVVSFSRKEIYKIKETIEKSTPHRCCVVYGSLPPQTRKDQARAFNSTDRTNPFSVLVASDAVGMGLNLKIKRVVFSATSKFDGERVRPLHKWEMLQIGGRAGRYGAKMGVGEVTCLEDGGIPMLEKAFDGVKMAGISHAYLRPELSRIEDFAAALNSSPDKHSLPHAPNGEVSLSYVLKLFQELHESGEVEQEGDERFFHLASASLEELRDVALLLEDIDMPLPHRLTFCMAPVDVDSHNQRSALIQMARDFSRLGVVKLLSTVRVTTRVPTCPLQLRDAEQRHSALELYLWLAQRFTDRFPDLKLAQDVSERSNRFIQAALQILTREQIGKRERKRKRRKRKQAEQLQQQINTVPEPEVVSTKGGAVSLTDLVRPRYT